MLIKKFQSNELLSEVFKNTLLILLHQTAFSLLFVSKKLEKTF